MAFSTEVLADLPQCYWQFRGSSNTTAADASGNGVTMTLEGGPTMQQPAGTGEAGDYAMAVNGANQGGYAATPALVKAATAITIEWLGTITNPAQPECVLAMIQPRGGDWRAYRGAAIGINSSGSLIGYCFEQTSGLRREVVHSGNIKDANVHHVVLTADGANVRLYVDGVESSASPAAMSNPILIADNTVNNPNPGQIYISGSHLSVLSGLGLQYVYYAGTVDEVAVYDYALSSARVAVHAGEIRFAPPVDPLSLDLPIFLWTRPTVSLFLPIELRTTEALSLDLAVQLHTGLVSLSLPIELANSETVSMSLPIEAQPITQSLINRSSGDWGAEVLIDGVDYSARLTGVIEIEQTEDASCLAQFSLIPAAGVVAWDKFIGKRVEIVFLDYDASGTLNYRRTRFIGVISDPSYSPATGIMSLRCTTDMQGTLYAIDRAGIDALTPSAEWSPHIFDEGAQGWDYFQDRLRTLQAASWHSPNGIILTDWAAKATPDFTFTDAELFEAGPYRPGTRQNMINKVQATFDYRFQRKRQRTVQCNWTTQQTFCEFLVNGWTLCQRSMVEAAAGDTDWQVQGDIWFQPLPPAGTYRCFPFASGSSSAKYIGWGVEYLGYLLTDPDWEDLCWGAAWKAARRWAQTVTERYSITIQATQSVAGNGEIVSRESYSLISDEDLTSWLDEKDFSTAVAVTAPEGYAGVGGHVLSGDGDYYLGDIAKDATDDELTGRVAADQARTTLIAAGVHDVLAAHRSNRVEMLASFQPLVNLTHTVRVESAHIVCQGKVAAILDTLNIDTGDATSQISIALSRHEGTGLVTTSPLVPNTPPTPTTESGIPTRVGMLTHIGGRTDSSPLSGSELGYFSNYVYDPTQTQPFAANPSNPQAVVYDERFICEYPEISGGAIDAIELPDEQIIDVEIPVDELTLTQ